jgi:ATP-dependent Clp protease protease subunit
MDNNIKITMPKEIENLQLPSPELITYYKNFNDRILWLDFEVNDCYLEFIRNILAWNKEDFGKLNEDRKPIKLMIYSYGGDLDINNSLIDIIKLSKTPVYGYNMGVCASAGCFIFLSCHKKYTLPNSYFLLHKGSAENISGTADQVVDTINEYQRKIQTLAEYIFENTKISKKELAKNICTEWYVSAKEAVEKYGIADAIITDIDEV